MYLSKLRNTCSNWYGVHGIVAKQLYHNRYLFSLTALEDEIIVLSSVVPSEATATIKLPEDFWDKKNYSFQIVINPVRCVKGKRVFVPNEQRREWFIEKMMRNGIVCNDFSMENLPCCKCNDKGNPVTIARALFSGKLTVSDPELFKHACQNGIGHGKAFGCGLLQVFPSSED